jgi:hypothetical protein
MKALFKSRALNFSIADVIALTIIFGVVEAYEESLTTLQAFSALFIGIAL